MKTNVTRRSPPTYEEGMRLFKMGRIPDAISVLKALLATHSKATPSGKIRSKLLQAAGAHGEGWSDDKEAFAVYLLGECYLSTNQFALAESQFRRSVAFDNHNFRAHYNLGLALESQDNVDEALQEYNRALALSSGFSEAKDKINLLRSHVSPPRLGPDGARAATLDPGTTEEERVFPSDKPVTKGKMAFPTTRRRITSFGGLFFLALLTLPILPVSVPLWVYLYLASRATRYVIWENRIDIAYGVFSKIEDNIWVAQIKKMRFERPFLKYITGNATIHIIAEGRFGTEKEPGHYTISGFGDYRNTKKLYDSYLDVHLGKRFSLRGPLTSGE